MWDKFGEFDSVEELNRAAAGQKEEGDEEALIAMAVENGLTKEDALDYMDGVVEELASPLMAAQGKIKIESAELKPKEIMEDWVQYILIRITEDPEMQKAVTDLLTPLEYSIAMLACRDWTNQEIGEHLGLSVNTVKHYVSGILEKLHIDKREKIKEFVNQ